VLEYTADKKISINHQDVQLPELEERLRTIFEDRKDKTMFISGDGALRYGDIINVIDAAKGAGGEKVGIVTGGMRKGAGGGSPGEYPRRKAGSYLRRAVLLDGPSRVRMIGAQSIETTNPSMAASGNSRECEGRSA